MPRRATATDSDLYDAGARPYDPGLGAFAQLDSVVGQAQDPLSLNRYLYAWANPLSMIDPTGHAAIYEGPGCGPGGIYCGATHSEAPAVRHHQRYVVSRRIATTAHYSGLRPRGNTRARAFEARSDRALPAPPRRPRPIAQRVRAPVRQKPSRPATSARWSTT